jgi:hypothetical protein
MDTITQEQQAAMTAEEILAAGIQELFAKVTAGAGIPVLSGIQAQGDLIILPLHEAGPVSFNQPKPVGPEGQVLIPEGRGGHQHRLVPGVTGTVLYGRENSSRQRGNIGVAYLTDVAYVLHHDGTPVQGDHAAVALAPGWYCFRQQRVHAGNQQGEQRWRAVAD